MLTGKFKYVTRPVPRGANYMGQAVYSDLIRTDEVVADLAAETGISPEDTAKVVRALGSYVVRATMRSHRIEPLFGYIGYFGSAGGSQPVQDFAPTFDNLNVSLNLQLGKEGDQEARRDFSAECQGHRDFTTPDIISVTNMHTNARGTYTPGKSIQVRLADGRLSLDPNDLNQGVFFKSATGQIIRASDYAYLRGSLIACNAPATLNGTQTISVAGMMNGSLRSGSWNFPLDYSSTLRRPAAVALANGHANGNGNDHAPAAPRSTRPVAVVTPAAARNRSRTKKAPAKAKA